MGEPMSKQCYVILLMVFFLMLLDHVCYESCSFQSTTLYGYVVDAKTGKSLPNATVIAWDGVNIFKTKSDFSGNYSLEVPSDVQLSVLVYLDYPNTTGIDYVPAQKNIDLRKENKAFFKLIAGASIKFIGDVLLPENPNPAHGIRFEVVNSSGEPLEVRDCITTYGSSGWLRSLVTDLINLDPQLVIVPANKAIRIKVTILDQRRSYDHEFVVYEKDSFLLQNGDSLLVDFNHIGMGYDIKFLKHMIESVNLTMGSISHKGFYVVAERSDLEDSLNLVELAEKDLIYRDYFGCYTNIRASYLKVENVKSLLEKMLVEGIYSGYAMVFLLLFFSICLSFVLFEEDFRKILTSSFLYLILMLFLYQLHPGLKLIDPLMSALMSFLSYLTFIGFYEWSVRHRHEGFALGNLSLAAFSIAKRSLLRRKIRFVSMTITVSVLVMSTVIFTSVSVIYGPVTSSFPNLAGESSLPNIYVGPRGEDPTSVSLSTNLIKWLQSQTEVLMFAPKVENHPITLDHPLFNLTSDSAFLDVYGVIGILPSAEAAFTLINNTIVGGRYLRDGDYFSIMISKKASENTGIRIGDQIKFLNYTFTVVGLFDDYALQHLKDLGGKVFPTLVTIVGIGPQVCPPEKIVVVPWKAALEMPNTYLSRIDVRIDRFEDLFSFSRRLVLQNNVAAVAFVGDKIYQTTIISYVEFQGSSIIFLLILVIFMLYSSMYGIAYERKKDVTILSLIGLTPSNIFGLVIAEAIILGLVGGGLGYILGNGGYYFISHSLSVADVRMKLSPLWGPVVYMLALLVTVTASLMPASQASVMATSSLERRWSLSTELKERTKNTLVIEFPAKIRKTQIQLFFSYLEKEIEGCENGIYEQVKEYYRIKKEGLESGIGIYFKYIRPQELVCPYTVNELIVVDSGRFYTLRLHSTSTIGLNKLSEKRIYQTSSFMRRLILEWQHEKSYLS